MGKGKLAKFADMEQYWNVFQYPYSVVDNVPFQMKGKWRQEFFHNDNPIVLELGCGKGEYTVGLARKYPNINFVGVDIKGARMWTGATEAIQADMKNVAFLRTNIEVIDRFFSEDEVQEIWLTFSDPQMKNPRKRLSSTFFLNRYRRFLVDGGAIHLKTDSNFLFTYTSYIIDKNNLPLQYRTTDLYATSDEGLTDVKSVQTYYEQMWMDRGISIKYQKFLLPRTGQLQEPDIEIELDDYRSYARDKRSSLDKAK